LDHLARSVAGPIDPRRRQDAVEDGRLRHFESPLERRDDSGRLALRAAAVALQLELCLPKLDRLVR
jgi:HD superfamily phosphodiesterase